MDSKKLLCPFFKSNPFPIKQASHAYIHLTKMDIASFHPSSVVPKLAETMLHHLQVDDGLSSSSLRTLLGFYYTLLIFWLLTLFIATGFQIKHRQSQ